MKIPIRSLILALCIPVLAFAKLKEFTVLGGEKIKAEVKGSMPLPAKRTVLRSRSPPLRSKIKNSRSLLASA